MSKTEKLNFLTKVVQYLSRYTNISQEVRKVIACQFALECNFGNSIQVVEKNNYCGMHVPTSRPTLALNAGKFILYPFAAYSNLSTCIEDYILCISFQRPCRKDLEDVNSFLEFIKFYCPDKYYSERIRSIYNQYFN